MIVRVRKISPVHLVFLRIDVIRKAYRPSLLLQSDSHEADAGKKLGKCLACPTVCRGHAFLLLPVIDGIVDPIRFFYVSRRPNSEMKTSLSIIKFSYLSK
jgi:hypothetical protein